jgi:glycosyltransferase involved in cell wall biosynthesis
MNKFLTVIVRVYNREKSIINCLNSILSQTFINDIQILIINDCSSDNSLNVVNKIKEDNPNVCIDIVSHEKNMGRGKALNTAKQYIEGKYCCILDSDDIYNRNTWVEELYNEIVDNEYDIIYNGNIHAYHWNNIYLSKIFKICPICNINYYEDHYTNWFFNNKNLVAYKYNLQCFITKNEESEDRNNNLYYENNKKFANITLQNLYEDLFFYKNHINIVNRFNLLDTTYFDDVLLESYNEIKEELLKNHIIENPIYNK